MCLFRRYRKVTWLSIPMRQSGEVATVTHFPPSFSRPAGSGRRQYAMGSEHRQCMLRIHGNRNPSAVVAVDQPLCYQRPLL
jgi:hypothetical protein